MAFKKMKRYGFEIMALNFTWSMLGNMMILSVEYVNHLHA